MSKPPFQLARIDHVVLRVRDTEAMQRFYCEVLGCREERRQDEIGLVQLRAGDSLIDLVALDGKLGRLGGAGPGEPKQQAGVLGTLPRPADSRHSSCGVDGWDVAALE